MKKLFLSLVAVMLLAGTAGTSSASTMPVVHRIPDTGYQYGYRAGTNWLNQGPHTYCDLQREWHSALTNVSFYTGQGDTGHADWWQGYADALHFFDNDDCSGPDCQCPY
jgi:hypothetical protein